MRAREFVNETKISKRLQQSTRGLNKFTDGEKWNSDYKMYRLGLAVAPCDGVNMPDVDKESWVGRWKTTHPYTQKEQDMLKLAYKAVEIEYQDVNNGDMESRELDSTNKVSPISNWMSKK